MQTTITARHCEITEALRERAHAVVGRLRGIAARPTKARVLFDADGLQQTAELRLHLGTGDVLVAGGAAGDHRTALDRAEEKLRKQLEKAGARPRRSRPSPTKRL